MKILSIETSCDDTGISILEATGSVTNASFKVLANNVASQIEVHIPYGGVFPALAKREHIKNLPIVLEKTIKEANLKSPQGRTLRIQKGSTFSRFENPGIDLIAVTYGPGLEPALWTGIVFAKELAKKWNVPIVPVNHMEGHIVSVFGNKKRFKILKTKNPTLALLVSGGHTELVLIKKPMDYKIIGQTLDDAVGEAFDKVARMLGLPYPGGPEISRLAEEERKLCVVSPTPRVGEIPYPRGGGNFHLPRPMLHSKNLDFSYSGLKTAVLYLIRDMGGIEKINAETKSKIALEFENAAIECLIYKTAKAIEKYKIKTLIVAGGVSANKYLISETKKLVKKTKVELFFPSKELTGDNSLMIGIAGYLNYIKNKKRVPKPNSIKAEGNLRLK
jgi:N6-L-threonylcarbamoyladenine synthase